ncbi:MAG: fumarylacetoacetate hydrolase family protein [Pirellulaceae bacterium]|nr:fumarylacetoacetate hydrolase family protein [Pirellulaceae bacterium]
MKFIRYHDSSGVTHFGCQHTDGRTTRIDGDLFGEYSDSGSPADISKPLAPLVPTDILCIGLNYARHAAEGNQTLPDYPILFMKNIGALQNPGDPIVIPQTLQCKKVDFECELAVVIGKECLNVSADDALNHVLGYTCAHDVSEHHWQMNGGGGQWCRAKTFAPFVRWAPASSPRMKSLIPRHFRSRQPLMARSCKTGPQVT